MFYLTQVIYLTVLLNITWCKSGIYVDDGFDVTLMEDIAAIEELNHIKGELLNTLEIPEPTTNKRYSKSLSAEEYALSVYNQMLKENRRKKRSINLDEEEQHLIKDTDQVLVLTAESRQLDSKLLFQFDLAKIPSTAEPLLAIFKIFQKASKSPDNTTFILQAYQKMGTLDQKVKYEFISQVKSTYSFQGWLKLNFTNGLINWMLHPRSNTGFYLTTLNMLGEPIPLLNISLITDEFHTFGPFMSVYLKNEAASRRLKRFVLPKPKQSSKRKSSAKKEIAKLMDGGKGCRKHNLYVNFKELGWDSWIFKPEGFTASYCAGQCRFPLDTMHTTNHALMQNLVHILVSDRYPLPQCAPDQMSSISVLYVEDETFFIKKIKDIAVLGCGCQ